MNVCKAVRRFEQNLMPARQKEPSEAFAADFRRRFRIPAVKELATPPKGAAHPDADTLTA